MIHYISFFEQPWRNEINVADAMRWHGYEVECYQVTDPRDRPGKNGAPPVRRSDVVFTSVPHYFDAADIQAWHDAGAKVATWYFDWLWGLGDRDEAYTPKLRLLDAVFSTDGIDSGEYEKRGIRNRVWLPQGAPALDRALPPRPGTPQHDVVFLGHINTPERREMAQRLNARFDFANYGNEANATRRIWGRERIDLCQSSRIMIGTNYRNDIPGYWSNRIYVVMSAGGFYLGQHVGGLDAQFTAGKHCDYFDGLDDMERKVEWWLKHAAERKRCAKRAQELVQSEHTYVHRVDTLLAKMRQMGLLR